VAFSPDGLQLASGADDGKVIVWDVVNDQLVAILRTGGRYNMMNAAWSPDGIRLVTGSLSGEIIIWDVADKQRLATLNRYTEPAYVAWNSDGSRFIALYSDRIVTFDTEFFLAPSPCRWVSRNLSTMEWSWYMPAQPYQPICPDLPIPITTTGALFSLGEKFARAGRIEEAIDLYRDGMSGTYPGGYTKMTWNTLCWYGSLWEHASDVIFACERAVELAPYPNDVAQSRGSRGVARAITGDYEGAIEDFEFASDWWRENDPVQGWHTRMEAWISELEKGRNPFDEATLSELRNE
jgi:hypothetical protein